jgi:hypothetical protein
MFNHAKINIIRRVGFLIASHQVNVGRLLEFLGSSSNTWLPSWQNNLGVVFEVVGHVFQEPMCDPSKILNKSINDQNVKHNLFDATNSNASPRRCLFDAWLKMPCWCLEHAIYWSSLQVCRVVLVLLTYTYVDFSISRKWLDVADWHVPMFISV